jgi:phosphoserine phosphatase
MGTTRQRLTLFDLDNTLLGGDSDYGWAQFLIEVGALDAATYEERNAAFFADYKAGRLDIHAFLDFQLRPLAEHDRQRCSPGANVSSSKDPAHAAACRRGGRPPAPRRG